MAGGYREFTMYEEVSTKTQIAKYIAFSDVMLILIWWMIFNIFKGFVRDGLTTLYTLVNIGIPFILTRTSMSNKGKSIMEAILYYFVRDKKTYHSIEGEYDEITASER